MGRKGKANEPSVCDPSIGDGKSGDDREVIWVD
jgi:hypothetical protein